jgi:hypothetical protein
MNFVGITICKTVASSSPGDSATLVYEVPSLHEAEVALIQVSNDDSNNKEINIQLRTNGEYGYFARKFPVSNSQVTCLLGNGRLFLKAGDKIVAYKESGSYNMDITVSLKQTYRGIRAQ